MPVAPAPTRRRRNLRRRCFWCCAALCGALGAAWVLSECGTAYLRVPVLGRLAWLRIDEGKFHLDVFDARPIAGPHELTAGFVANSSPNVQVLGEMRPFPAIETAWNIQLLLSKHAHLLHLALPIWLPLAAFALTSVLLARRGRRTALGHCQKCGYDLTANQSGICPECGRRCGAVPRA